MRKEFREAATNLIFAAAITWSGFSGHRNFREYLEADAQNDRSAEMHDISVFYARNALGMDPEPEIITQTGPEDQDTLLDIVRATPVELGDTVHSLSEEYYGQLPSEITNTIDEDKVVKLLLLGSLKIAAAALLFFNRVYGRRENK